MTNLPTQIEYGVCAASDADAMAKLLGEVFSRHDPPAYAVGVTAPEESQRVPQERALMDAHELPECVRIPFSVAFQQPCL